MIIGIGNDIVDLRRMARVAARFPQRLPRHILSLSERAALPAQQPILFLAGRWAAKEALGKAMGWGIRAPLSWQQVAVARDDEGKPYFVFTAPAQAFMEARGVGHCHLSISHDGDYACAMVVAEGEG